MLNFTDIGETTLEKCITKIFCTLQYFGSPGGPPGPKITGLSGGVHLPPLATCKISSRSDDPSPRYLLSSFVDFVAGVTHKKHTVNDMSPHYMRRQKDVCETRTRFWTENSHTQSVEETDDKLSTNTVDEKQHVLHSILCGHKISS